MSTRSLRILMAATAGLGLLATAAPAHAASVAPSEVQQPCTITGGAGDDVLRGTPGNDVICGLAGDDIVLGLAGNDVLYGGPGDDILVGAAGRDTLLGESGDDDLVDTREPGTLSGGAGADLCVGVQGTMFSTCERVHPLSGDDDDAV